MTCLVERRRRHRQLAERLRADPTVEAVDVLTPAVSPSGRFESDVLAHTTMHGGVESAVLQAIIDADLTLVTVTDANSPDYRRVIVR
jgi:hypothetical protein